MARKWSAPNLRLAVWLSSLRRGQGSAFLTRKIIVGPLLFTPLRVL